MRTIRWMAMAIAMSGCAAPSVVPWTPPEQASLEAAWTDCSGGQSCVVVQLGCCDHCNGGAAVSVSVDAVAEVEAELAEEIVAPTLGSIIGEKHTGMGPTRFHRQRFECGSVSNIGEAHAHFIGGVATMITIAQAKLTTIAAAPTANRGIVEHSADMLSASG